MRCGVHGYLQPSWNQECEEGVAVQVPTAEYQCQNLIVFGNQYSVIHKSERTPQTNAIQTYLNRDPAAT